MTRQLDDDPSKWSDDDRAWAAQRPEQYPDVAPEVGPDPSTVTLSEAATPVTTTTDDYDTWTLPELKKEANDRDGVTKPTGDQAKSKYAWIDALRAWDAQHPAE